VSLPVIEPMTVSRIHALFDHPDFLFELKHDGFRSFGKSIAMILEPA
jgi:hypothetical protein